MTSLPVCNNKGARFFLLVLLLTPIVATAQVADSASAGDSLLVARDAFAAQGDCAIEGMPQNRDGDIDPTISLWSCPGVSQTALAFAFSGGEQESCLYIDNYSDPLHAFFVPLRTYTEWSHFKQSTLPGGEGSLEGKVSLTYGCPAQMRDDTCEGVATLPEARNGAQQQVTVNNRTVTYTCMADSGCGSWIVTQSEGQCASDGLCGSAHGRIFGAPPSLNLCTTGAATNFIGNGPWSWTCAGVDGGQPSTCIAYAGCRTNNKPVNLAIVLDASGSMQDLVNAAKSALIKITNTYLAAKPHVTVSVTVFGGEGFPNAVMAPHPEFICPFGKLLGPGPADPFAVTAALDPIVADNNTPLAYAITQSAQEVEGKPHPVLIVLTDGIETCDGDVNAAVQVAKAKGIKLFGIAYGDYDASSFTGFDSHAPAGTEQQVLNTLGAYVSEAVCE